MPVAAGQGGERASMEDHGSDFGPCSAMRPLDDADPRELAREGWDSDADWDYRGPEPCCSSSPAPPEGGSPTARAEHAL
jgi:hypothetical protein